MEEENLPSAKELKLLAHLRVAGTVERAVVAAKRVPTDGKNTVHLVSIEKRYEGVYVGEGEERHLAGLKTPSPILTKPCVVSLYSWSFSCTKSKLSFEGLLHGLQKAHFAAGSEPLMHSREDGTRAMAEYRGPLMPPATQTASPTALLLNWAGCSRCRTNRSPSGSFVSSGATRKIGGSRRKRPAPPTSTRLPRSPPRAFPPRSSAGARACGNSRECHSAISLPSEKLLPRESMRFFRLDDNWIANLLAGALGVGGGYMSKEWIDRLIGKRPVTGVVLRSQLIGGWPAMSVKAWWDKDELPCLRTAHLSPNILMVLFEGIIGKIGFSLPVEALTS